MAIVAQTDNFKGKALELTNLTIDEIKKFGTVGEAGTIDPSTGKLIPSSLQR